MKGFNYTIRLIEPVLANSLAGDINSARSFPYIPGALVRGALINEYLTQNHISNNASDNSDFRRLFLDGSTCYLHAYPKGETGRMLPAQLSWKSGKDDIGSDIINLSHVILNDAPLEDEEDKDDLKGVSFPFCYKRGNTVYSTDFLYDFRVHHQRDAVFGRATEDRGAIYRYEALPPGMALEGVILTKHEDDLKQLKTILENNTELFLGKSRTAGYGRVKVESVKDLPEDWREGWVWEPDEEDDHSNDDDDSDLATESEYGVHDDLKTQTFVVVFLSAGIVRDSFGQVSPDPLPAIRQHLGIRVTPKAVGDNAFTGIFRKMEIVGGFNRTWGLPLPQTAAIAPGSVFVLETDRPVLKSDILKLEQTGLGERKAEGFGRISVSFYQPKTIRLQKGQSGNPPSLPQAVLTKPDEKELAEMMLKRLLRRELDNKVMETVKNISIEGTPVPDSQISRWRAALHNARLPGTSAIQLEPITTFYVKEKDKRSAAWVRMERTRLKISQNSYRLTEWIFDILTDSIKLWDAMGYVTPPSQKFGDAVQVQPDEFMCFEYKLWLIEEVLKRCAASRRTS